MRLLGFLMRKNILLGFFYLLCFGAQAQVVSLDETELSNLKNLVKNDNDAKKQWEVILKKADEALSSTPNPADTILSEGILQGDPRKTKTQKSLADMPKVYVLALAYKVTSDQKYLAKTIDFLSAWAKQNQPQGNPINDTNLDAIIFAYDLVKKDLDKDLILTINSWFLKVASEEIRTFNKSSSGKGTTYFNNWNSHRIKLVTEVAWAIGDVNLKDWSIKAYKTQIAKNLNADGSSFDFDERDALHYHVYDVDPLMVAATIMQRDKKLAFDAYNYKAESGSSLNNSVAWLIPFFNGEKSHPEFVKSKVGFDKKRAENGEKGYIAGTLFKPNEARTSIALADFWDSKMLGYYQQQAKTNSNYPTWQFVLNKVKK